MTTDVVVSLLHELIFSKKKDYTKLIILTLILISIGQLLMSLVLQYLLRMFSVYTLRSK